MITDKYCAGLVDSDGYIGLAVSKVEEGFSVKPRVTIKQRKDRSKVLYDIAAQWEIKVYDDANTHCIVFSGNKALRFLESIKNHLVIKPDVAEFVLRVTHTVCSEVTLKDIKNALKLIKATPPQTVKNFPSRKWLAGYFDGDGCLLASKEGRLKLQFAAHVKEQTGLLLIQKVFGGSIHIEKNSDCAKLHVYLPQSKLEQMLGYFGKHTIIKNAQVQYVLGHAGKVSGNELYNKLRQLKQPASTK